MPCLLVLVALISPRFALFLLLIFTDRLAVAFNGAVLPILGFFLLPWTTFMYTVAYAPVLGVTGIGWFFVAFGFFLDVASWGASGRGRRGSAGSV